MPESRQKTVRPPAKADNKEQSKGFIEKAARSARMAKPPTNEIIAPELTVPIVRQPAQLLCCEP
jgi:hypothetical protein